MVIMTGSGFRELTSRIAAAVVGGYTVAVAASICLSFAVPMARADAVLTGLLVSFVVYAVAILWAFAVRSLSQMWWGIGSTTAISGVFWALLSQVSTP